jgi:putative ABC transport system permease protein
MFRTLQDLRYAFRNMRRHPLVAGVAILTLGLGIGATTAVFSVVDALLLRPLPFHQPDELVRIVEVTPEGSHFSFSRANYLDLGSATRGLRGVAAYLETGTAMTLAVGGDPQRITAVPVTASTFDVLGVRPALGRSFTADEDRPGAAERPLVLSDALWKQRFGATSSILERSVTLDGTPYIVIGVMPPRFDFPQGADAWIPLRASRERARDDKELAVIGRLAPGVTLVQARGELRAFARQLSDAHPESNAGWSADAVPFYEWLVTPRFRDAVWIIFGAVAALLVLACANVANLLVAHGATREGEMRMRAALGASRTRIVRQLFTEAALVGVLGTGTGVLVAFWAIAAIHMLGAARVPRLDEVRLDTLVLGFASVLGLASCIVFGLAPALQAASVDLRAGSESGARHTSRNRRTRQTLVIVEFALAVLLLVSAGLLANSFIRLLRTDPGFDARGVLAMSLDVSPDLYPDDRLAMFYRLLLDRVRALPGVVASGATSTAPFQQSGFVNNVTPEERAAEAPPSGLVQAGWRSITPGFLEAMGIPLLAGRAFGPEDHADSERVVLVSLRLAQQLWPGQDPVGKRIYWGGTTGRTRTVIGVSADFQDVHLGQQPPAMLLVPHSQASVPAMTILVRTLAGTPVLAPPLRALVREADAALPAPEIREVESSRSTAAAGPRFNAALIGTFAAIGLVLAVTGVYAMLAFSVAERRRELAVRLALGAGVQDVVRLLVGGGLMLAAIGTAIGVIAAVAVARVMRSLLFDVAPTEPWTFAAAVLVLLTAAALACYLPARRAGRLDPMVVLRD